MLSVHLICVGKLKEKFYREAVEEYTKRLSAYCKLNLVELPEVKLPQNPSQGEIQSALDRFHDEGKDPNLIANGMSHMKTAMKLGMEESDATVAELMTDGCNMGVKSLNQYLNQYEAADEVSKDITKRLINLEERLAIDIRQFL